MPLEYCKVSILLIPYFTEKRIITGKPIKNSDYAVLPIPNLTSNPIGSIFGILCRRMVVSSKNYRSAYVYYYPNYLGKSHMIH